MNAWLSRNMKNAQWWMLCAGWRLADLIPPSLLDKALYVGSSLACASLKGFRERNVEKYNKLLGSDATSHRCHILAEKMLASFLKNLSELPSIERMAKEGPHEFIEFHNLERLDAALAKGRGVIFTSVHVGNWELTANAIACLGYPMHVVAWAAKNPKIEAYIRRLRKQTGVVSIFPDVYAQMTIYRALKANSCIAFVLDIGRWESGDPVKFCGSDYLFPRGPLFFAQRTGAALIPSFNYRDDDGKIHVVLEKPMKVPSASAGTETENEFMQELALVLERYVREYPEQWLWMPGDENTIEALRQVDGALEETR